MGASGGGGADDRRLHGRIGDPSLLQNPLPHSSGARLVGEGGDIPVRGLRLWRAISRCVSASSQPRFSAAIGQLGFGWIGEHPASRVVVWQPLEAAHFCGGQLFGSDRQRRQAGSVRRALELVRRMHPVMALAHLCCSISSRCLLLGAAWLWKTAAP